MSSSISKKNIRNLKYALVVSVALIVVGIVYTQRSAPTSAPQGNTFRPTQAAPSPATPYNGTFSASLFVPYWLINDSFAIPQAPSAHLDVLLYFGVTPQSNGTLQTDDPGYKNVQNFREATQNIDAQTFITVRMMNEDIIEAILKSPEKQAILAAEVLDLAIQYHFNGIALDLEHSVLPTQETIDRITAFVRTLSRSIHAQDTQFALILYGDTYFRIRPYDVKKLADSIDMLYIMAYDFHKTFGTPGPNFPLQQGSIYPYSLDRMLADFSNDIPTSKISIIFGLFGYDWAVDEQNRPLMRAGALTFAQIRSRFYENCPFEKCTITRDSTSAEQKIVYLKDGRQHVVWFEDPTSIQKKSDLLRVRGVSRIGFWAHGYY